MQARAKQSDLHQLASGIAEAIDVSQVNGNDDTMLATPTEPGVIEDGGRTPTSSTDGWEAEDDAWDQAVKASEARAAAWSSNTPTSSTGDIPRSPSQGLRKSSMSAARRSSVVRTATVTPPEDMDTVLIRDTECAMVKCDTAEPIPGTLVVTRSEMSFEPEMDEGDLESRKLYAQRHRRWPLAQFRRVYLRSFA